MIPSKFRSIFTGKEIDDLLAQVKDKVDTSQIKSDYTGGEEYVASAELAKLLNEKIEGFKNPDLFKSILLSIPDNNIFTNADKNKLLSLSGVSTFVGAFENAGSRTAALDTNTLNEGMISFIIDDGMGMNRSVWSRWDATNHVWVDIDLKNPAPKVGTVVNQNGTFVLAEFDQTKFTAAKVLISCSNSNKTALQVQEVMYARSADESFLLSYGDIGNIDTLYTLSVTMLGDKVQLIATTNLPNLKFSAGLISTI